MWKIHIKLFSLSLIYFPFNIFLFILIECISFFLFFFNLKCKIYQFPWALKEPYRLIKEKEKTYRHCHLLLLLLQNLGGNMRCFSVLKAKTPVKVLRPIYIMLWKKNGIFTFKEDEKLVRGKSIPEELLKIIEESRFAIVIFLENYASFKWCLDKLAHIVKCKNDIGLEVVPVFYHVNPSCTSLW